MTDEQVSLLEKPWSFGRMIRHWRTIQELSLQQLSDETNVDISTISRIENGNAQVTLSTAVRLCKGLDITFGEVVYYVLQEERYITTENEVSNFNSLLSVDDIDAFITFARLNPQESIISLMGNLLRKIYENYTANHPYYLEKTPLGEDDINKMFALSPIYKYELCYPGEIDTKAIRDIYKRKGVITSNDARIYIKLIPFCENFSLASNDTRDAFRRIQSTSLDRVKLKDILLIDSNLTEFEFLGVCWRAWEFEEETEHLQSTKWLKLPKNDWVEREKELVTMLVTLFRWLYSLGDEITTLNYLRQEIKPR